MLASSGIANHPKRNKDPSKHVFQHSQSMTKLVSAQGFASKEIGLDQGLTTEGRQDPGVIEMFSDNINLIDLRQQRAPDEQSFQFESRARQADESSNYLSRETLSHLQNSNLMDLQLADNSKMSSGPYKRQKTSAGLDQSASKRKEQHLDVRVSSEG